MPHKDPEARRAYLLEWRQKNKEKIAAYWSARPEKKRAKYRRWYEKNRAKAIAYSKAYREAHREEILQKKREEYPQKRASRKVYAKRYQQENIEKIRHQRSHFYEENKARLREIGRQHYENNKERYFEWADAYRARKHDAPINDFTQQQWKDMKAHYGHKCVYCGKKSQRLTQDHIIPLSKGGAHTMSNIVPACKSCNSKKHVGPPIIPVQPLLL